MALNGSAIIIDAYSSVVINLPGDLKGVGGQPTAVYSYSRVI